MGQRIDQVLDQPRPGTANFAVFAAHRINLPGTRAEKLRNFVGVESRGIDNAARLNGFRFGLLLIADAQAHLNGVLHGLQGNDSGVVDKVCSLLLGNASERMHQVFRGANARGRHQERRMAFDVRLDGAYASRVDDPQFLYAVALSLLHQGEKLFLLGSVLRDDKLSRGAAGHVVPGAEFLRQAIAFDTVTRLPGIFRIVDSGMDHAAIARAGGHSELWILLNEKNILPAAGERFGNRATHDTTSNNQDTCLVHVHKV